jgi:hypothetical protein
MRYLGVFLTLLTLAPSSTRASDKIFCTLSVEMVSSPKPVGRQLSALIVKVRGFSQMGGDNSLSDKEIEQVWACSHHEPDSAVGRACGQAIHPTDHSSPACSGYDGKTLKIYITRYQADWATNDKVFMKAFTIAPANLLARYPAGIKNPIEWIVMPSPPPVP